ncbi:hypothetical protein FGO68_gene9374 [Halteria grandinella]|uniref:Uncharacterized protein n=1 Tax=Halteria grandinella TaxID=5974 RepID=A0A8J8NKY9_HALGN|nr:hypothetical protein FGO68_gene9374 [Halteria grandinella]
MDAFLQRRCEKCKKVDCKENCEQCDYCKGWDRQLKTQELLMSRDCIQYCQKCEAESPFQYCTHCNRLFPESAIEHKTNVKLFCEECWVTGCSSCKLDVGDVQDKYGTYYCLFCFQIQVCGQYDYHQISGNYDVLRCKCRLCRISGALCERCCKRIYGANSQNNSILEEQSSIDEEERREASKDVISYAREEESGKSSQEEQ